MTDLDAGWKAIEHQPADFSFQDRDQLGKVPKILIVSMNGCGKVALEIPGDLQHFIAIGVAYKKRRRSKDFRIETLILQKRRGVGLEQYRTHGKTLVSRRFNGLGSDGCRASRRAVCHRGLVRRMDIRSQESAFRRRLDQFAQLVSKWSLIGTCLLYTSHRRTTAGCW